MIFADSLKFVAAQAALRLPELSKTDRIKLLTGLSTLLQQIGRHTEAEQCDVAAEAIRRAEEAQLVLGEMLTELK